MLLKSLFHSISSSKCRKETSSVNSNHSRRHSCQSSSSSSGLTSFPYFRTRHSVAMPSMASFQDVVAVSEGDQRGRRGHYDTEEEPGQEKPSTSNPVLPNVVVSKSPSGDDHSNPVLLPSSGFIEASPLTPTSPELRPGLNQPQSINPTTLPPVSATNSTEKTDMASLGVLNPTTTATATTPLLSSHTITGGGDSYTSQHLDGSSPSPTQPSTERYSIRGIGGSVVGRADIPMSSEPSPSSSTNHNMDTRTTTTSTTPEVVAPTSLSTPNPSASPPDQIHHPTSVPSSSSSSSPTVAQQSSSSSDSDVTSPLIGPASRVTSSSTSGLLATPPSSLRIQPSPTPHLSAEGGHSTPSPRSKGKSPSSSLRTLRSHARSISEGSTAKLSGKFKRHRSISPPPPPPLGSGGAGGGSHRRSENEGSGDSDQFISDDKPLFESPMVSSSSFIAEKANSASTSLAQGGMRLLRSISSGARHKKEQMKGVEKAIQNDLGTHLEEWKDKVEPEDWKRTEANSELKQPNGNGNWNNNNDKRPVVVAGDDGGGGNDQIIPPNGPVTSSSLVRTAVPSTRRQAPDPSTVPAYIIPIPSMLREGCTLLKVSKKKAQAKRFWLIPEEGKVIWESGSARSDGRASLNIENIRELRLGPEARPPPSQARIALNHKQLDLCISIIYTAPPKSSSASAPGKAGSAINILYLIAFDSSTFNVWKETLSDLWKSRSKLKSSGGFGSLPKTHEEEEEEEEGCIEDSNADDGMGSGKKSSKKKKRNSRGGDSNRSDETAETERQMAWERMTWRMADFPAKGNGTNNSKGSSSSIEEGDGKLTFDEIVKMCRRLAISASKDTIKDTFEAADLERRGYLDFSDFQRFVKLLKKRPELERLYESIRNKSRIGLRALEFSKFMLETQKSTMDVEGIYNLFSKFATQDESSSDSTERPGSISPLSVEMSTNIAASILTPQLASTSNPPSPCLPLSPNASRSPSPVPSHASAGASFPPTPNSSKGNRTPILRPFQLRKGTLTPRRGSPAGTPSPLPPLQVPEGYWTFEAFTSFLLSSINSPFTEEQTKVCHDMTRSLCDYYVCSSHNTYLVGNQLQGQSTAEGYVRALQQGCRSVELDCWDGPDEPVVFHGRTLTSKLSAREAFAAIAKYAFVASPYPVILSVEVHCCLSQQDKLAKIMKDTLGHALLDDVLSRDKGKSEIEALPSPEELKGKILLKAKDKFLDQKVNRGGNPEDDDLNQTTSQSESTSSDSDLKRVLGGLYKRVRGDRRGSNPNESSASPKRQSFSFSQRPSSSLLRPAASRSSSTNEGYTSPTSPAPPARPQSPTTPTPNISPSQSPHKPAMSLALAALLVYTVGVKARGFNKKEHYDPTHILSLGERKLAKIIKDAKDDLVSHTRNHMVRTYPAGTRVTSSNYLPMNFWSLGMQLVALNWQTFDLGMEINTAFFSRNGRCGYVLKPDLLRTKGKGKDTLSKQVKFVLNVEVLSAQQLPTVAREEDEDGATSMDPCVEIGVYAPGQTSIPKKRTRTVRGNGFNPSFGESFRIAFTSPGGMLELAFVRFEVLDLYSSDEKTIARACLCAKTLQPGYRHLPLYDQLGDQYLFSTLFVKINIESTEG